MQNPSHDSGKFCLRFFAEFLPGFSSIASRNFDRLRRVFESVRRAESCSGCEQNHAQNRCKILLSNCYEPSCHWSLSRIFMEFISEFVLQNPSHVSRWNHLEILVYSSQKFCRIHLTVLVEITLRFSYNSSLHFFLQNPSGDSYRIHQKYYYRTCILILVNFGSSLLQNASQDSLRIYLSIQPESISGFSRCWFTDFFFSNLSLNFLSTALKVFEESTWPFFYNLALYFYRFFIIPRTLPESVSGLHKILLWIRLYSESSQHPD